MGGALLPIVRWLPFEELTLSSTLPIEEIHRRLVASIEPRRWFRNPFSDNHKPYEGEVSATTFSISRIIHYRNSFLPRVNGTIHGTTPDGAAIQVTLRLATPVLVFMAVWLGLTLLAGIAFLASEVSHHSISPPAFIPLGMFLFGYTMMMGAFLFEAAQTRRFFEGLFR